MDNKEKSNGLNIIKILLIALILVVLVLLIRNLIIIANYKIFNKEDSTKQGQNIEYHYDVDETNSVELANLVATGEKAKMQNAGIDEKIYDDVVIKDNTVYNYDILNEFYNTYGYMNYNGDDIDTELKVNLYTDDDNYKVIKLNISIVNKGLSIDNEKSKLIITNGNEVKEFEYTSVPIVRKCEKNDNNKDVIVWYYIKDAEEHELFRYLLSSTPYYTNYDFVFESNSTSDITESILKNSINGLKVNVYTKGGNVKVISHELQGDKEYTLEETFKEGFLLTVDEIKNQCEYDDSFGKCLKNKFEDGGSLVFEYNGFKIFLLAESKVLEDGTKENSYDSVYITSVDISIDDVKKSV